MESYRISLICCKKKNNNPTTTFVYVGRLRGIRCEEERHEGKLFRQSVRVYLLVVCYSYRTNVQVVCHRAPPVCSDWQLRQVGIESDSWAHWYLILSPCMLLNKLTQCSEYSLCEVKRTAPPGKQQTAKNSYSENKEKLNIFKNAGRIISLLLLLFFSYY